jgi:hypothetical protein
MPSAIFAPLFVAWLILICLLLVWSVSFDPDSLLDERGEGDESGIDRTNPTV